MRKNLALSFALAFTTLSSFGQTLFLNPVARYNFTFTGAAVPDNSPSGSSPGIASNLTTVPGFHGVANGAKRFNGLNSGIVCNSTTALNSPVTSNQVTLVALVRFNNFNSALCQASNLVCKGFPQFVPGNYMFYTGDNTFDNSCNVFSPNNNQTACTFGPVVPPLVPGNYLQYGPTSPWYMLAVTYRTTTASTSVVKIYQLQMDPVIFDFNAAVNFPNIYTSGTINNTIGLPNTQPLTIGFTQNPPFRYTLDGDLDELLIFDYELTPFQLGRLYKVLWGKNANLKTDDEEFIEEEATLNSNNVSTEYLIYPNPSTGTFQVALNPDMGEHHIIVSDLLGKTVYQTSSSASNLTLDLSSLAKGNYFVQIRNSSAVETQKLILQ